MAIDRNETFDVIVVGAGPAGFCGSIAPRRTAGESTTHRTWHRTRC